MEHLLIFLAIFILGGLTGWVGTVWSYRTKKVGTLRVDHSDPDSGPYLFLEIDSGKSHLIRQNQSILLDVDLNGYISRD